MALRHLHPGFPTVAVRFVSLFALIKLGVSPPHFLFVMINSYLTTSGQMAHQSTSSVQHMNSRPTHRYAKSHGRVSHYDESGDVAPEWPSSALQRLFFFFFFFSFSLFWCDRFCSCIMRTDITFLYFGLIMYKVVGS